MPSQNLRIDYIPVDTLQASEYNPRKHSREQMEQLKKSIASFDLVDPLIANSHPDRKGVVIGGHMRLLAAKELGYETVPVVWVNIADIEREKSLNLRLNKNTGTFDEGLLAANFSEEFLTDIGFTSEELDEIFIEIEIPEEFDLEKELEKLNIGEIATKPGDVWQLGPHRLMCGDSMAETDILKLMNGARADLCLTDPPYILDYLHGKKKNGKPTEGFGLKRDRKYLGTDSLPENFSDLWMANVAKVQKENFSILIFENPKNLRTIWNAMERYWRYRNTIVWHLPNRVQGFAAKYKFFNKHDIALVGTRGKVALNLEPEADDLFEQEYENALFATSGKPQWESYEKGKKMCPTDFIEFAAADEKSSGQGIIFGTKPIEILIPYIKVLTKRGDLMIEPFSGSGSTMCAAHKLGRMVYGMEKSPVYCEVIKRRFEKLTGIVPVKIDDGRSHAQ